MRTRLALAVLVVVGAVTTSAVAAAAAPGHRGSSSDGPNCDASRGAHNGAPKASSRAWSSRCGIPTTTSPKPTVPTSPEVIGGEGIPRPGFTVAEPSAPPVATPAPASAVARSAAAPSPARAAPPLLLPPQQATPPAIFTPPSAIGDIPVVDDLFGDPAGLPLSMALVIGVAGLATMGFVLRGTLGRGRRPHALVDEVESLTFR